MKRFTSALFFFIAPLLAAVYPTVFLYSNNVNILNISSLTNMLILSIAIVAPLYLIVLIINKFDSLYSATATLIFAFVFNVYGIVYSWLLRTDMVQVEHYTLLPLVILLAIYIVQPIKQLKAAHLFSVWKSCVFILGVLIAFNTVKIIPGEIRKVQIAKASVANTVETKSSANKNHPDIYYIVFDEFAGFDVMREYWQYDDIDHFVDFLKNQGFFVAERSQGSSIDTLHEMATRLNYADYPLAAEYQDEYFKDIADNKVMRYLKSIGYTTVVFDETRASFSYPAKPPVIADYSYEYDPDITISSGALFDDFGILVADNTMLRAFSNFYKINNPAFVQHKNMIYFTTEKIADLNEVPTPKFVYIHLMLPHMPFMFDANGNNVDPKFYANWNYYLGNYIFATHIAEKMVTNILSTATPDRPPVIILQSDHGARNLVTGDPNSVGLQNYPEEYKKHILFALYIPGYDFSDFSQDVDPINTFPIILNYCFNAKIPIVK
jgi:hypothetical protein